MSTATYKNPWHKPARGNDYGPEYYVTDARPTEYRDHLIYQRIPGAVWDVVKDGVCLTQMAGPNGAKQAVDQIIGQHHDVNVAKMETA